MSWCVYPPLHSQYQPSNCLKLETLRLYPPAVTLLKSTGDSPVNITYNDQSYQIPSNVPVLIDVNGLHYSEEYWGPDAATFNPKRWDKRNRDSFLAKNDGVEGLSGPGPEAETIHRPVRGSYVPFSDGARACTGKKFAQVEFVAALTVIFREYRVMLARDSEAQTGEEVRGRAERVLEESSSFITLWMGGEVPLLFQKRSHR